MRMRAFRARRESARLDPSLGERKGTSLRMTGEWGVDMEIKAFGKEHK